MTDGAVAYRHPELGFEIKLPEGLEVVETLPSVALLAIEPEPPIAGAFRAHLTVTVEEVAVGTELEPFADEALALQERELASARLLARTPENVAGVPAVRTLAHHREPGQPVTLEQWRLIHGACASTVGCVAATMDLEEVSGALARAAQTFRPGAAPVLQETSSPRYDPIMGVLLASERTLEAFLAPTTSSSTEHSIDDATEGELTALAAVGAIVDGRPHESMLDAFAAVAEPACELSIVYGDRWARAWVDTRFTALLIPAARPSDERRQLLALPTAFLPDALARLVDLGPPFLARTSSVAPFVLSPGELARLLAGDEAELGETGRALVEGRRGHWRIESRWVGESGAPQARVLEVVDTEGGPWCVVPRNGQVELQPATSSQVWNGLKQLLPRAEELAAADEPVA